MYPFKYIAISNTECMMILVNQPNFRNSNYNQVHNYILIGGFILWKSQVQGSQKIFMLKTGKIGPNNTSLLGLQVQIRCVL